MNTSMEKYPEPCRKNIIKILNNVKTDAQTAYAMLLLTAALTDLCPADPKVAEIILDDYKGMKECSKDE